MALSIIRCAAVGIAGALTVNTGALAQTLYTEQFEDMGFVPIGEWGPAGLIDKGWIFQNNTTPLGTIGFVPGCCWEGVINPLSGSGYLASYQDAAGGGNATYSNWAILPEIEGQQAGDMFGFYTVSSDTSPFWSVSLEVRYAPNGGTDVGTTAFSVGDFTHVLLDIATMPNYNTGPIDGWTYWAFELPGPGRIALRQDGTSTGYFGIEDISITHTAPPCPADLTSDGFVDVGDLVAVISAWGTPGGDTNGDGTTDVGDLVAVISAWGSC
ncbi:MAG: choice-of-anchor J domain-containing protein [Planctomycetota bacterium]|jgi:hypothetical protein